MKKYSKRLILLMCIVFILSQFGVAYGAVNQAQTKTGASALMSAGSTAAGKLQERLEKTTEEGVTENGELEVPDTELTMDKFITDGALYAVNNWDGNEPQDKDKLENGAEVSVNDQLVLKYLFDVLGEEVEEISKEDGVKQYKINCPEGLKLSKIEEQKELKLEGTGDVFTTLTMDGSGSAHIKFVDNLAGVAGDGIEHAYFYLACTLDEEALNIPSGEETQQIKIAKDVVLDLNIAENAMKESTLKEKTGTYANGKFTWKVTFQPGNKEDYSLTFVDEFDNAYHDYVENSFKVDGSEVDRNAVIVTRAGKEGNTKSQTTISYNIPDDKRGEELTFMYETALTNEGITQNRKTTVKNIAKLEKQGEIAGPVGEAVSAESAFDPVTWLEKDGVVIGDTSDNKAIQWTVTIYTNNKSLSKLILHDEFASEYLTLKRESITVKANGNDSDLTEDTDYTVIVNPEGNKGFSLAFQQNILDDLAEKYVITYETPINRSYFEGKNANNNGEISNKAYLEFAWPSGDGYFVPDPPTVEKPVPVDGRLLQKEAVGYDRATHEITWKVTVNPFGVNLGDVTVTDDLTNEGQTYVNGSFFGIADNGIVADPTQKVLTLELKDVGTTPYTYTFKTTVDNIKDYAYNHEGKTYNNTAKAEATLADDSTRLQAEDSANVKVTSNVLKKEGINYNYKDKTITWKVTVNENGMPMDNAVLIDKLAAGLSYKENSAALEGTPLTEGVTFDNGTLTIDLGNEANKAKKALTFETTVDVDAISDFAKLEKVILHNTIQLKRVDEGMGELQDASGQIAINNKMLGKSGTYDHDKGVIDYVVNINPIGLKLEHTAIKDQLPEGLQVDPDTIKLYHAEVDDQGNFTKGGAVQLSEKPIVNILERHFSLNLPDGNERYILEYTADVTDLSKAPFKNTITMTGTVSGDAGNGGNTINVGGGGGGGGITSPKVHLTVKKVDSQTNTTLAGAKFLLSQKEIIEDEEGNEKTELMPIAEAVTGQDGTAVFKYLKREKLFVLEEMEPPHGYSKLADPIEVTTDEETVPTGTKEFTVEVQNSKFLGTVEFKKVNEDRMPLAGAEFTLSNEQIAKTAVSDGNGIVTFNDVPYGEYTVTETKAPNFHTASTETYKTKIETAGETVGLLDTAGGAVENNEVINTAQKGTLIITKVDKETQQPLEGVTFTYTDQWNQTKTTAATDSNGEIKIENLPFGEYTLKENPYKNYQPLTETFTIDEAQEALKLENVLAPPPTPGAKSDIKVIKTDGNTDQPLQGVEFKIYDKNLNWCGSAFTDAKGELKFSNLTPQEKYTIVETVPPGYSSVANQRVIESLPAEGAVIQWKNYRIFNVSFTLYRSDTDKPIPDIEFGMWNKDSDSWEDVKDTPPISKKKTDRSGKVEFNDLKVGFYWLKQLHVPDGLTEDRDLVIMEIGMDENGQMFAKLTDAITGEMVDANRLYNSPGNDPSEPSEPDRPDTPDKPEIPDGPGGSDKPDKPQKPTVPTLPADRPSYEGSAGGNGGTGYTDAGQTESPQTGDNGLSPWLLLAAASSLIAAASVMPKRRPELKENN